jgi:predicted metal-dependent enzyme (double-stranded beta helix superfamily)
VHDHTVWGLIGVLRGEEMSRRYVEDPPGRVREAGEARYQPGAIDVVSPARGDIHEVISVYERGPSVSIHVYGANIGAVRRHVFDIPNGGRKGFVSGYSSPIVPNLWSRPL